MKRRNGYTALPYGSFEPVRAAQKCAALRFFIRAFTQQARALLRGKGGNAV